MYGEHYGNSTGYNETLWPQIHVYTSPDLVAWADQGPAIAERPPGTYFTPFTIYNNKTGNFAMWFNAYTHGCCSGNFGVAVSSDGINFKVSIASRLSDPFSF
jgi:hypothetical protein